MTDLWPQSRFVYYKNGPDCPYFLDMLECCGFQRQGDRIRHLSGEMEWAVEEFDLYEANMALLREGIAEHIYELLNMFFMFQEQYDIVAHRYLRRTSGEVVETPWEMCERVADYVSDAETLEFRKTRKETKAKKQKWFRTFYLFLLQMKFMPNTPTLSSGGIKGYGSFACAVLKTGDSHLLKHRRHSVSLNMFAANLSVLSAQMAETKNVANIVSSILIQSDNLSD